MSMATDILVLNESGDEIMSTEERGSQSMDSEQSGYPNVKNKKKTTNIHTTNHNNNNNNSNININKKGGFRIDDILFSVCNNALRNTSSQNSFANTTTTTGNQEPSTPPPLSSPSEMSICSSPDGVNLKDREPRGIPVSSEITSPSLYLQGDEEEEEVPGSPPIHHAHNLYNHTHTLAYKHTKQHQRRCYSLDRIPASMIDCTRPRSLSPTMTVHPSQQSISRMCSESK